MANNSSISVSAPYTLFPIAQPLTAATPRKESLPRRIYSSEVLVPVQGKKRKRGPAELCAAVDGDGVNIYNVTGTQIISSYPLPPDTAFSCAPLSVRFSIKDEVKQTRQSYAAVARPKQRLVGWTETPREEDDEESAPSIEITPHTRDISSKFPITLLARIGHKRKAPEKGYVLALKKDSSMTAYSPNLAEELWTFTLRGSGESTTGTREVKFATVTKASIVQQSLLSERPDVNLKQGDDAGNEDDDVLFVITSGGLGGWEIHLILLPNNDNTKSTARVLLTLPLQEAAEFPPQQTQIAAHLESGSLHLFNSGRILSFNLNSTMPKLSNRLDIPSLQVKKATGPLHFLQLSPSVVMIASTSGVSLLDTKYSSIQARIHYSQLSEAEKKDASTFVPTTWLKSANLMIGASMSGLSAIALSKSGKGTIFSKESSLIDSLGRGLENKTDNPPTKYPGLEAGADFVRLRELYVADRLYAMKTSKELKPNNLASFRNKDRSYYAFGRREFENAKAANDVAGFEKAFTSYCGITVESAARDEDALEVAPENLLRQLDIRIHRAEPEGLTEEISTQAKEKLQYPRIPHDFALDALKNIITPGKDGRLHISFFAENVFKILVLTRNVTTATLRALKLANGGSEVDFGEFVDCLVEHDPSLKLLAWVLQRMPEVEPSDTVRAIRVVLQRIFDPQNEAPQPEAEDEDMMAVDEESPELQLQRETMKAEKALEDAQRVLRESGLREFTLRIALARLSTFPHEIIVKNLKKGLDGDQLLILVRMLRKELILDRDDVYEDADELPFPALQQDSPDNAALICDILTCCLDAVGLTGLILANEPTHRLATLDDGTTETAGLLVESLLDEVQKSVSALENSVDLGLFLGELIRHSAAIAHYCPPPPNKTKKALKRARALEAAKAEAEAKSKSPKSLPPTEAPSTTVTTTRPPTRPILSSKFAKRKRAPSRAERLARANRGRLQMAERKQRAVPEQVTAIRRMVAEMLPMFGAKRGEAMKTEMGVGAQLAMGVVGGRGKYAVEKVDV